MAILQRSTESGTLSAGVDSKIHSDVIGPIHNVVVHRFTVGDIEDPDLWAGEALYKWEISEAGQWVMNNSLKTPIWHRQIDLTAYGYNYIIVATLDDRALVYFKLRWT